MYFYLITINFLKVCTVQCIGYRSDCNICIHACPYAKRIHYEKFYQKKKHKPIKKRTKEIPAFKQ